MQSWGGSQTHSYVYPGCLHAQNLLRGLAFLFNHRLRANIMHLGIWNYPSFSFFSRKSLNAPSYLSLLLSHLWPGQVLISSHLNYSKSLLALPPGDGEGYGRGPGFNVRKSRIKSPSPPCMRLHAVVQSLRASLSSSSTHPQVTVRARQVRHGKFL